MPAGFAAIGGAALFGGLQGAAAIVTGIAVSAVVGAAIGGLTAAVMGGDIGKGMLFGAVGGVVTGGLAGGSIMNGLGLSSSAGNSIGTISMGSADAVYTSAGGQLMGSLGEQGGVAAISQAATATGPKVFGGGSIIGKMFEGSGGALISGVGAAFAPEPEMPFGQTKEGVLGHREHEKEMAKLAASLRGGGGGGGGGSDVPYMELERLKQKGALNQIAAEAAEQRKALQIQGSQKMQLTDKEYKLANQNAQAEWDRGMGKLRDAAGAGAGQQYQSGEGAYEQVLAAQRARGQQQTYDRPGDTPTGPVPEAALGGAAIPATGQTYVPSGNVSRG